MEFIEYLGNGGAMQISNESLLVLLAVFGQLIGVFKALSGIRVEIAERLARVETNIDNIHKRISKDEVK